MRQSKGNSLLSENMPKLVEYFTRVYGEEYKSKIEDRLYNTIFVFMDSDKKGYMLDSERLDEVEDVIGNDIVFEYVGYAKDWGIEAAGNFVTAYFDKPNQTVNVCIMPESDKCNDAVLIHELGHIIQSDVKFDGRELKTHTGFMVSKFKVDLYSRTTESIDVFNPVEFEQMEYLNEVINDYLTLKVVKLMEQNNFKLFDNEKTTSLYSLAFPALQDFIDRIDTRLVNSGFRGKVKILSKFVGGKQFTKFLDDLYFLFKKFGKDRIYIENFLKENNLSAYGLMREKDISWLPEKVRQYIELCNEIENDIGDYKENELVMLPSDDKDEKEI